MIKIRDDFLFQVLSENGIEVKMPKTTEPKAPEEPKNRVQREIELLERQIESSEGEKAKTSEEQEEPKDENGEDKPKMVESLADKDIGFSELGGFDLSTATGLLDEQPLKLHPVRQFFPGQVYGPDVI